MGCILVQEDPEYIKQELEEGLFNKIFPDHDIRKSWLQYISIAFEGRNYKKCAINHGHCGNNGKSKTCEFICYTFGGYGQMGDTKTLLKGKKDRGSLANLHQKRFLIYEEPDDNKAIDTAMLKALVGGVEVLCARMLYSMQDQIDLHNKMVINVNNLPGLSADKATLSRIVYYPWITEFVDDDGDVDHANRKYKSDPKYGDKMWWQEAAPQLVHLLLRYYKQFREAGRILYIPPKIKEMTKLFCQANDPFMNWFNRHYELLDMEKTEERQQFVTYLELQNTFKASEDKDKIIPNRYSTVKRFISQQIRDKPDLAKRKNLHQTNWRLTAAERKRYRGKTDCLCKHGEKVGAALQACRLRTQPIEISWNYDIDEDAVEYQNIREEQFRSSSLQEQRQDNLSKLLNSFDEDSDDNREIDERTMELLHLLSEKIKTKKRKHRMSDTNSKNKKRRINSND